MSRFDDEVARRGSRVPPGLAAWIRAHHLEEAWTPVLHTTTAWIASAAPPWATPAQRAVVAMDLGTCFFLLDDAADHDALARHDDLARVAAGCAPDRRRPLQPAFADLFARLAALGGPLDHYLALRREFAAALRRRHALRTGGASLDVEGYLALREITIYYGPWLSVWELLGGFVLSPAQRALVAPAFVLANRWQVLENERMSVARDQRTGTPNVIALHARARGKSLGEAVRAIGARADADLAAYRGASAALRAPGTDAAVLAYLDAVDDGVAGAIRHHQQVDPARYQAASSI